MNNIVVHKYGGKHLANIACINEVALNIKQHYDNGQNIVVVVSAMSGETDNLVQLINSITSDYISKDYDIVVSSGEQVSLGLLSTALKNINVDTSSYLGWQLPIITDNNFSAARIKSINTDKILFDLKQGKVVIVAGFQGINDSGNITTFGRGGSDATALALSVALGAESCIIFKDVGGVFQTDPHQLNNSNKLPLISSDIMLESASLGADILHVRCCELSYRYNIDINVGSINNESGSLITNNNNNLEYYDISNLTSEENLMLCNIHNLGDNLSILMLKIYDCCEIDMLKVIDNNISFCFLKQIIVLKSRVFVTIYLSMI